LNIDTHFPTAPKPSSRSRQRRRPTRFEVWAWSPIKSFQVGLTTGYIALIFFGISSIIAAPASLGYTSPAGWTGFWSVALVIGAIVASVGSISRLKLFERAETVGATLISLTVGSYALLLLFLAYALGDTTKIATGAGFAALAVPVIVRTMWLYSQLLRR